MRVSQEQVRVANDIDYRLRTEDLVELLLKGWERDYVRWYARLLTTLTLVVGEQRIIFGQSRHSEEEHSIEFVLVTERSVIVVTVDGFGIDEEPIPGTRVIPRSALATFSVRAAMAIDQEGSSSQGWPGGVNIEATYTLPADSVVLRFAGLGYRQGQSDERGDILDLLDELQKDLGA